MGKGSDDGVSTRVADSSPAAQREETDASLRAERQTADERAKAGAVDDDADRIVDLARDRADAVLTDAREKADQVQAETGTQESVDQLRFDADELLEEERAAADEILRRERQDSARLLSSLLPVARTSTNRRLLTERASADAALSSRDDFLGMVSHDLNHLLGGIVLSASTLERRGRRSSAAGTSEGRRNVADADRILLFAARMKRLIGDLVDVTSLTVGQLSVTAAPNDAWALVAEVVESFGPLAAENRVSLESPSIDVPLPVSCDRGRIVQVLANLVGNAIKFTLAGGRISLQAEPWRDQVRLSVIDTGPGIPAHLLDAVFERFWQAREDQPGLGLGLYIAKAIVEAHLGTIWAESVLGQGSSFHFTLPRAG